jgi:hypothetical protein
MGFQTGTQIDPRLNQADFSGFTNAAAITAEAQKELAGNISDAISAYQDNKKEDKAFAQKVKSSLALTDAMMENLPPEQADQLARFATESGVNDPRLSMRERAQAAETFGASLGAVIKSIQGDEITFDQGPGGLTVVRTVSRKRKTYGRASSITSKPIIHYGTNTRRGSSTRIP